MLQGSLGVIGALVGLAALLGVWKIVKLAYIHPYAKYPGPWLAKYTNLYTAYHGWKGDIHLDIYRCHMKYGRVVRYGPYQIVLNSAEAFHDVYDTARAHKFVKSISYKPLVHRTPNTLTIRSGPDHARRRRIISQGISERAQRGYEHRIVTHVLKLCDILFHGKQVEPSHGLTEYQTPDWSTPMDMSHWCSYLSFDIMTDVVFGASYNLLEKSQFRFVPEAIEASNVRMSTFFQFPALMTMKRYLDKTIFRAAIAGRNQFVKFAVRLIKERTLKASGQEPQDKEEQAPAGPDIFGLLQSAKDPETGQGFSKDEIQAESVTLIVAGSDTTSTAMSGVFFYLANNPSAYENAAAEVRDKFSDAQKVSTGASLSSCSYLRACIDESLRMSGSVGLPLWRESRLEDTTVDGETIPLGHDVGVSLYALHHNNECFKDPYEYRPERWLIDDGTGSIARGREAFAPFSQGVRSCLGKGLAMNEMMLTMATVLHKGDFRLTEGPLAGVGRGKPGASIGRHRENEYQLWDYITAQTEGPFLQFRPIFC